MNIIQEELDIQSEYMFISVMVMVHLPMNTTSIHQQAHGKVVLINEVLST